MIEIPLKAQVYCSDGRVGRSTNIIVNPVNKTVTHFVVREDKAPHQERVVAVNQVKASNAVQITLNCTKQDFSRMDSFIETHYVRADIPDYADMALAEYTWPYRAHDVKHLYTVKEERIPPHELAVRRGAQVAAKDGPIGLVEEFLIEPQDGHITHLVLREGHFWGKKHIGIPVSKIEKIDEEVVYLNLKKAEIEKLSVMETL